VLVMITTRHQVKVVLQDLHKVATVIAVAQADQAL
jgi:hypothetical protein